MTEIQKKTLQYARNKYGKIYPCIGKTWEGCFTNEEGYGELLWFNNASGNTLMMAVGKNDN